MNISLDTLLNIAGAGVTVAVGWLESQRRALRKELDEHKAAAVAQGTRIAVLETKMDSIPRALGEMKDELKGLRADMKSEMGRLYEKIDQKADR